VAPVLAASLPGRPRICLPLSGRCDLGLCDRGSGWACNEAGLLDIALARSGEDLRRLDPATAADPLRRGCELGFGAACGNLNALIHHTGKFAASPPTIADYPIILRGSKGPVRESDPPHSTRSRAAKAGMVRVGSQLPARPIPAN
jgi:hypothetical protein